MSCIQGRVILGKNSWYTYIVRCADNTLYTGITTDLDRRIREHNCSDKGARYTRSRRPVELVYSESFSSRSKAAKRETVIKKMRPEAKKVLADDLHVARKKVKHARIRVGMDRKVQVSVPSFFSDAQLQQLLREKTPWIEKTRSKMTDRFKEIHLEDDQVLYLGEVFTFSLQHNLVNRVEVDIVTNNKTAASFWGKQGFITYT